ncbi:MAG: Ig-like domain-containing protein [Flavobacteriales bacterium]|nr:MAG: Ig-like domain-containing protein [Flavobacteriales bacterium]
MLFVAGCAQVREPTGGDQDKVGPKLVDATPQNGSTAFKGDRIVLRFSERVQVKNARENLVVSPPLAKAPTLRVVGDKSVQIGLEAPLAANTTYVFDYAKAIVDLTEGNQDSSGVFVISTGPVIDQGRLRVHVSEARTGKVLEGFEVLLYPTDSAADVRQGSSAGFARTMKDGHATVGYLRDGEYRVFALEDKNGNHRYDLPNERLAFAEQPALVRADTMSDEVDLRVFTAMDSVQRLLDARWTNGVFRFALSRPAGTLETKRLSGEVLDWEQEWNTARDTVRCWYAGKDSLASGPLLVLADGQLLDTAQVEVKSAGTMSVAEVRYTGTTDVLLEFDRPVEVMDSARVEARRDSVMVPVRLVKQGARRFRAAHKEAPGGGLKLAFLPGALQDRQGRTNDTLRTEVRLAGPKEQGTLHVVLNPQGDYAGPYILELLDQSGRVMLARAGGTLPSKVGLSGLPPEPYGLRLVLDANGNGRWDTGAFGQNRQPERVVVHPAGANVRAGWEVELVW